MSDGHIQSSKECHCGRCHDSAALGLGRFAAAELKEHYGWRQVRPFGWVCRSCLTALSNEGATPYLPHSPNSGEV